MSVGRGAGLQGLRRHGRWLALIAGCCALGACSGGEGNAANMVDVNAAAARAQDDIAEYASATNGAHPASRAAKPVADARATPDDGGPVAAAAMVTRYFTAIGERRYDAAWAMWDQHGAASGMSASAFAESFDKYATYSADVGTPGDGDGDAGAGQVYITVPVRVTGVLKSGGAFAMEGPVVLHRVNDGIETSDPHDHRWHIRSSDLTPRP